MNLYNIDQYKNPKKMMNSMTPKVPSFGSANMNIPKL